MMVFVYYYIYFTRIKYEMSDAVEPHITEELGP